MILIASLVASCMVGGDKPDKINGITARDVPILAVEAKARKDGKTIDKIFLDQNKQVLKDFYDLTRGPHGENKDWKMPPNYRLVEYKANEDIYYYLIQYPDTRKIEGRGEVITEHFKVIRTPEGWKAEEPSTRRWEYETQGLSPRVVKEVHDEP